MSRRGRTSHGGRDLASALSGDEIEARRVSAAAQRAAHELRWLEAERVRYGLPRRARALSGMVA